MDKKRSINSGLTALASVGVGPVYLVSETQSRFFTGDTARVTPPGNLHFTKSLGRSCGNVFSQPRVSRLRAGANRYRLMDFEFVICIPVPNSGFRIAPSPLRRETDVTDKKKKKSAISLSHTTVGNLYVVFQPRGSAGRNQLSMEKNFVDRICRCQYISPSPPLLHSLYSI